MRQGHTRSRKVKAKSQVEGPFRAAPQAEEVGLFYIANVALCQLSYTPGSPRIVSALISPGARWAPSGIRVGAAQRAAACGISKSSSSQAPGKPALAEP